jgi:hypothetical protein
MLGQKNRSAKKRLGSHPDLRCTQRLRSGRKYCKKRRHTRAVSCYFAKGNVVKRYWSACRFNADRRPADFQSHRCRRREAARSDPGSENRSPDSGAASGIYAERMDCGRPVYGHPCAGAGRHVHWNLEHSGSWRCSAALENRRAKKHDQEAARSSFESAEQRTDRGGYAAEFRFDLLLPGDVLRWGRTRQIWLFETEEAAATAKEGLKKSKERSARQPLLARHCSTRSLALAALKEHTSAPASCCVFRAPWLSSLIPSGSLQPTRKGKSDPPISQTRFYPSRRGLCTKC